MKHAKEILIIIVIIVLGFFVYQNSQDNKHFKNELKAINLNHKQKLDSLNSIIATLSDSIQKEKQVVQELEQSEQEAKNKANKWQYSYSQLKKQTPKTLRDSLNNYKAREKVLLSENKSLRQALKIADSAKAIQFKTITKLDMIVLNKDSIIKSQDLMHLKTVELYEKDQTKQQIKGAKKGVIGTILITIAIILI